MAINGSIFTSKNLSQLNLRKDYILCEVTDKNGRSFIKVEPFTLSNLGLFKYIKAWFRCKEFNLSQVASVGQREIDKLNLRAQGDQAKQLLITNIALLNEKINKYNTHHKANQLARLTLPTVNQRQKDAVPITEDGFDVPEDFGIPDGIPKDASDIPDTESRDILKSRDILNKNSKIVSPNFNDIQANVLNMQVGQELKPGQFGIYPELNPNAVIARLAPEATQYVGRHGVDDQNPNEAPPACTLHALLAINHFANRRIFNDVINLFSQKTPLAKTTLSNTQIDLITYGLQMHRDAVNARKDDLRLELARLQKQGILFPNWINDAINNMGLTIQQAAEYQNTASSRANQAVINFIQKITDRFEIKDFQNPNQNPNQNQCFQKSHLKNDFTGKFSKEVEINYSRDPNNGMGLPTLDATLDELVADTTNEKSSNRFKCILINTPNSLTVSVIYDPTTKMAVIFNSHTNSITLVSQQGLKPSLKLLMLGITGEIGGVRNDIFLTLNNPSEDIGIYGVSRAEV